MMVAKLPRDNHAPFACLIQFHLLLRDLQYTLRESSFHMHSGITPFNTPGV